MKVIDTESMFYKPRQRAYKTFGNKVVVPFSCVQWIERLFLLFFSRKTEVRETLTRIPK